jgi:hypothetical protein
MNYTEMITHLSRYLDRVNEINVSQMCGLAKGTTSLTLKTTAEINFFLYNSQFVKAATDNIPMTACAEQAINTFCYYLVSVNMAGTITTTKGTDNAYTLPSPPSGNIAIGAIKIETDSGHTFTSGTTGLTDTGITYSCFDIDSGMAGQFINQAIKNMETAFNFRAMKTKVSFDTIPGTATYSNPITGYKEFINAWASASGNVYPLIKQAIEFVDVAFGDVQQGFPQYWGEVPQIETSLTPDAAPALQLKIAPIPDSIYTVYLTAYQYSPYLDGVIYTTNWWTANRWEVLLYEALIQAEPFLKNDERVATWKSMSGLASLIKSERSEEFAGSHQYPTPRNVI